MQGFIEIHSDTKNFVTTVSEKPFATKLSRYQANLPNCTKVTSATHVTVPINLLGALLLRHCDGKNNRQDLVNHMIAYVEKGDMNVSRNNERLNDPQEIRSYLQQAVDELLPKMAAAALFEK
jgi:methyltransferase-like protein